MDVKRIFSKEITTKPFTIQFAKDRKYEEAWIINLDSPRPSDIDIDNYLNDKFDLLIVEYIWYESKNTSPFVLTIFLDENCKLQNRIQFVTGHFHSKQKSSDSVD